MDIKRDIYLNKMISYMWDGQVKVITGIRRCGKSYLLNNIFRNYLLDNGTNPKNILSFELDLTKDIKYRNPLELANHVRNIVNGKAKKYYLFVDEIQLSDEVNNPYNPGGKKITFYDALNELRLLPNLDIYVTGSNSKMLSSDILTEFRGRSDEIRVHPLSFSEFYAFKGGDVYEAFDEYSFYGGMPFILSRPNEISKMEYLSSLFSEVYLKDIVERKKIRHGDVLSSILDLLSSSIGSLSNPTNITNSLNSKQKRNGHSIVSYNTTKSYIDYLIDAYLISECKRYDVKGKNYFDFPNKYYFDDIGLRNARIGFRQLEMTHIMENIIYNELLIRGYSVDVGVVYANGKDSKNRTVKVAREVDFVATIGSRKIYIQSAFAMHDEVKTQTEKKPFSLIGDSFPKIIVRNDIRKSWYDDDGILNINIIDFLLDK